MTPRLLIAASAAASVSTTPVFWAAVIAAVVALINLLVTLNVTGSRERKDRHRQLFADAYATVIEYREFAYRFRRRASDNPEERARLTDEMSACQQKLRQMQARLQVEAPAVAKPYERIVTETRRIAGAAIKRASQAQMTDTFYVDVTDIDYSQLAFLDKDYLNTQRDHLSIWPRFVRRLSRRILENERSFKTAAIIAEGNATEHSA